MRRPNERPILLERSQYHSSSGPAARQSTYGHRAWSSPTPATLGMSIIILRRSKTAAANSQADCERGARATLLMLGLLAQTLQPLLEELQPQAIEFPAMLGQIRFSQSLPTARSNGFAGRHGGTGQLRGDCRWSAPFRRCCMFPSNV